MKKLLILIAASIILISCGGQYSEQADMPAKMSNDDNVAYEATEEYNTEGEQRESPDPIPNNAFKNPGRKLIKEGNISFETGSCKDTKLNIEQAVKSFNGYLSSENVYAYSNKIQHSVTVRIPSDKFDAFLVKLSSSIQEIDDKNISVQDVTEEYVDVKARLKAKKEVEKRYIELLAKAHSVGDVLQVEHELSRLREEIEAAEGRLRYLKNQVSLSTLHITYYEITSKGFGFGKKASKGLANGYKGLLWFFIGLINIWPFLLILVIGVWLLVRWIKRSRRKTST